MRFRLLPIFLLALSLGDLGALAAAPPDFSQMLHWRNIGPYRGGLVRAISGVPSQPNVFYMAQVNGGAGAALGLNSPDAILPNELATRVVDRPLLKLPTSAAAIDHPPQLA